PERGAPEGFVALDRIADQPRAVELLRRALASDRVAHAYAFIGPSGAGRMTTALAFAAELLGSPSRQHPDLHVIVPTPPEPNPRGRDPGRGQGAGSRGALPPARSPGAREGGGAGGRLLALLPRPPARPERRAAFAPDRRRSRHRARARGRGLDDRSDPGDNRAVPAGAGFAPAQCRAASHPRSPAEPARPAGGIGWNP